MLNAAHVLYPAYRAERAKGIPPASAYHVTRGDYDRTRIALDWDGYESAEARVGDYDIEVEVKPDYEMSIADQMEGEFSEDAAYRLLPWGGKRNYSRRYVLASALTTRERDWRRHVHTPSTRSDRNYGRESWSVWYTDFGIAGGSPKGNSAKQKHDMMDWYWRHGYSKSDAYLKATQQQREAADRVTSGDLEFYDLHVTVSRDGAEVTDSWRGGFDVDGSEPAFKAFAYLKDEAAVFAADVLHEIETAQLQKHGLAQPSLL